MNHSRITSYIAAWIIVTHPLVAVTSEAPSRYGHQAYDVVSEFQLVPVGKYRASVRVVRLLLRAALAFKKMQDAAELAGVSIIPISGYRSLSYQEGLFKRAVIKYGSEERAARWVAPPGYSEHHTGLALDVGDQAHPECDVEPCFEKGAAYAWLKKNAARFGYELSFPLAGTSVSFEPWHWRFVGDRESRRVFGR